jgi:hypothetical protein
VGKPVVYVVRRIIRIFGAVIFEKRVLMVNNYCLLANDPVC